MNRNSLRLRLAAARSEGGFTCTELALIVGAVVAVMALLLTVMLHRQNDDMAGVVRALQKQHATLVSRDEVKRALYITEDSQTRPMVGIHVRLGATNAPGICVLQMDPRSFFSRSAFTFKASDCHTTASEPR